MISTTENDLDDRIICQFASREPMRVVDVLEEQLAKLPAGLFDDLRMDDVKRIANSLGVPTWRAVRALETKPD